MRQNDTEMQFYLFIYFFNITDFSSNYTRFISISNKNVWNVHAYHKKKKNPAEINLTGSAAL